MPVYDEEKEKTTPGQVPDGSHDDLGVSPEQRQPEINDLEKAYTPENKTSADRKEMAALDRLTGGATSEIAPGWQTNIGGRAKFGRSMLKNRKLLVAGGGMGILLATLLTLFLALVPYKAFHVLNTIEQRVGEVPQYAVERRVEYYMNRYLILKTLESSGIAVNDGSEYTYIGDGVFKTLYTNWQGAKLEAQLSQEGYKLIPKQGEVTFRKRGAQLLKPSEWVLEKNGKSIGGLDTKEARSFIKNYAKKKTRWNQVLKRHHMRTILKKYYGVDNWKPFEKETDKLKRSYLQKKAAFKQRLIQDTVGKVSEKYGTYLSCLLESDSKICKENLRQGKTSSDKLISSNEVDNISDDAAEQLVDETSDLTSREASEKVAAETAEQVRRFGLKKILSSIVAVVGIVDFASNVVQKIDDGTLNQIVYAKNSQTYASFTAPFLSGADQIRAGEDFDIEDARVLSETLDGFESSPVYRASKGISSADPQAEVRRDCNNDGDIGDPEDILPPGETVCPDKRLVQNKTSFTDSDIFRSLNTFSDAWEGTAGSVVQAFNDGINAIADTLGVNAAIEALMERTGIGTALSSAFEFLLERIFSPVATGAETGPEAYDALYAGVAVRDTGLGGAVGLDRENTIGGGYLSSEQLIALKSEASEQRQYELGQESMLARYFSPTISESLTGRAVTHMPATAKGFANTLSNLFTPSNYINSFSRIVSGSASAQESIEDNPFHAVYYGYPTDSQIFTANDGEGMSGEEIQQIYQCDLHPDKRPQNQNTVKVEGAFDTYADADPCLLEKVVEQSGSMFFTGKYDDGIDGGSSSVYSSPSGNSKVFMLGDSYTVGMESLGQIGNKFKAAGWQPTIDAACGRPLAGLGSFQSCDSPPKNALRGMSAITDAGNIEALSSAGTVVIALGTNDLTGNNPDAFRANVKDMISKINDANSKANIYWVNLYTEDGSKPYVPAYNAVLKELSSSEDFAIIDWNAIAPQYYEPGGLHPTDYQALSTLVINSVGAPNSATQQTLLNQKNTRVQRSPIFAKIFSVLWGTAK